MVIYWISTKKDQVWGWNYRGNYRGMSSRYAAFAAYRCENPSAAAGALASNWILRR